MTKKERNAARGQECTLRIAALAGYGGCASTETTVLAHAPCRDDGKGYKSPDLWAAFSCHTCHALMDGQFRFKNLDYSFIDISTIRAEAWLRGIYETQKIQGVFDE